MTIFILDGGYFVKRMQYHWTTDKGKNMAWWFNEAKQGKCTADEMEENINRILKNDLSYLEYKMRLMGDIEIVYVCYDGIFGRRPRGKIYKGYKRKRSGINPKKHKGIDVRDKVKAAGYDPMNLQEGWHGIYDAYQEADDLIAEIVNTLTSSENDIVVMSNDSDMFQLLAYESVRLHNFTDEITSENVFEKCGVYPDKYVDWKSLVGDNADNIPGVPGIGKATATKLLNKYGRLEDIPSEALFAHDEDARLWKRLIKLPFIPESLNR